MSKGTPSIPPEPKSEVFFLTPEEVHPYLVERFRERKVAVLAGAGASASAGLPLWSTIGEELKRLLGKSGSDIDNVAQLASIYVSQQAKARAGRRAGKYQLIALINHLMSLVSKDRDLSYFGEIYPRLAQLPVNNFYTTNWDQLLVQCLNQSSSLPVDALDNSTIRFNPGLATGDVQHVVFLHGTIPGALEQIIATSEDYYHFEQTSQRVFSRLIDQLKADTTLLGIGYSFSDLNVAEYLRRANLAGNPSSRIYALLPRISRRDACTLCTERRILPIVFDVEVGEFETWLCKYLDSILAAIAGTPVDFVLGGKGSELSRSTEEEGVEANVEEMVRRIQDNLEVSRRSIPK